MTTAHDDDAPALVAAPGGPATLPAGKVLVVMVVALVLAALFNSARFVHAAEGMPLGWQRTALLGVARPVHSVATFLHTDRPRAATDRALGREETSPDNGGAFEDPGSVLPTASPSPGSTASPGATASPTVPPAAAFRDASPAAPLRLFVTGDSMVEFMAPKLIAEAAPTKSLAGSYEVKYGTGLVRDDFFDWPAYARALAAQRDPEAVSFMIGGNDAQNMSVGGRILQAGSAEWGAEYQKRAAAVMRGFARSDRRVYWIGMPIARSDRHTQVYRVVNDAVRKAAAGVPGVEFVDIWAMFAPNGRYQDSFANEYGTVERMRSDDGIHLSVAGAAYLARHLLKVLNEDWHLTD